MHQFDSLELAVLTRLFNAAGPKGIYVKAFEFGVTCGEFGRAIEYLEKCGLIKVSWHDGRPARGFGLFRRARFSQCRGRLSRQGLEAMGGRPGGAQRSGVARPAVRDRQARALSRW